MAILNLEWVEMRFLFALMSEYPQGQEPLKELVLCEDDPNRDIKMTMETMDRILYGDLHTKCDRGDLIALWMFYGKHARLQGTKRVQATVGFILKSGLGWGEDRIRKARNGLKELGLIQDYQQKTGGDFSKAYVRLCYVTTRISEVVNGIPLEGEGGERGYNSLIRNKPSMKEEREEKKESAAPPLPDSNSAVKSERLAFIEWWIPAIQKLNGHYRFDTKEGKHLNLLLKHTTAPELRALIEAVWKSKGFYSDKLRSIAFLNSAFNNITAEVKLPKPKPNGSPIAPGLSKNSISLRDDSLINRIASLPTE